MKSCKNCNESLDENSKFCKECGAKYIDHRLTLKYLFSEISNGFLNIDSSKPIRTFVHLFTKPEEVIVGYINGTRKKYINAFGYFTIAITLASIFIFILMKFFPELIDQMALIQPDEKTREMSKEASKDALDYQSLIFFASIPLMALLSRLLFLKNKRFNYAEHLVINLYAYSHISIVMYVLVFPISLLIPYGYTIASLGSILLYVPYYFYVLKRIYNIEAGPMVLKTLLFSAILFFTFIVFVVVIFFTSGQYEDLKEKIDEKKEAKKETIETPKDTLVYAKTTYIASSINWTS